MEYCNSDRRTYLARAAQRATAGRNRTAYVIGPWATRCTAKVRSVRCRPRVCRRSYTVGTGHQTARPHRQACFVGKNGWSNWDMYVIDGLAGLVECTRSTSIPARTTIGPTSCRRIVAERAIDVASSALRRRARTTNGYPGLRGSPTTNGTCGSGRWTDGLEERLQLFGRSCCRDLPEHLCAQLPVGEDGNLAQMVNAIAPMVTTPTGADSPAHLLSFPPAFSRAPRRGGRRVRGGALRGRRRPST